MALQIGKDVLGIAKQTAKGTIATNPYFAHGLAGGGLKIDPTQAAEELTSAYLNASGAYREKVENGADFTTRAWQKAVGLYFLLALGSVNTTGAGPYTHVITLGSSLLYATVFEKKGDDSIHAVKDCKLDELEISWDENKPVELKAKFVGGAWSSPATFTPTADESDTTNRFTPVGGTFKYDADSATPVTASVLGGKVTIKRSPEAKFFSGSVEAGDVWEGGCEVETMLKVVPHDTTLWRTLITGTSSGTAVASSPVYGSFEHTFVKGSDSLKIAASSVAFLCDLPEADPKGGAAVSELSGLCYRGATATPLTVTLINTQVSY